MLTETVKGQLITSLHSVNYVWDEDELNPIAFTPTILRSLEDAAREAYSVVVEFRPTGRKHGDSLTNFVDWRDDAKEYADFGYADEELCTILVLVKSKWVLDTTSDPPANIAQQSVHGRYLAFKWADRIERFIRLNWESISRLWLRRGSYTTITEIPNFFAEKQYLYQFSFSILTNHGWSNEPTEDKRSPPDVEGIEVEDSLIYITS